jgi:two-component system, OmpR family, sensor histidine kinase TctE
VFVEQLEDAVDGAGHGEVSGEELRLQLGQLLDHQKRFVRDTSHQLRTPLAVLRTQVQSARRGDVAPEIALREIEQTVDGATTLANQMLALAKVEQLRQQGDAPARDWSAIARAVALDVAPLIADRHLDFDLQLHAPAPVRAHEWALRELTRNLLHNAIRHSPPGAALLMSLGADDEHWVLRIRDHGTGIDDELRERLFQPFARGAASGTDGAGLGLAICREIVQDLGGTLSLDNRREGSRIEGLDAVVSLPRSRDG